MPFDLLPHRTRIRSAIDNRTEPLDRIAADIGWPGSMHSFCRKIRDQLGLTVRRGAHEGRSKLSLPEDYGQRRAR